MSSTEERAFYKPHMPASELQTVRGDRLSSYPAHWELLRWYACWRKFPYQTEAIACLVSEARGPEYAHFPCRVDSSHWHLGRGGNKADPRKLLQRAKRVYRRAVRDEIWRRHVVQEKERNGDDSDL